MRRTPAVGAGTEVVDEDGVVTNSVAVEIVECDRIIGDGLVAPALVLSLLDDTAVLSPEAQTDALTTWAWAKPVGECYRPDPATLADVATAVAPLLDRVRGGVVFGNESPTGPRILHLDADGREASEAIRALLDGTPLDPHGQTWRAERWDSMPAQLLEAGDGAEDALGWLDLPGLDGAETVDFLASDDDRIVPWLSLHLELEAADRGVRLEGTRERARWLRDVALRHVAGE